MQIIATEERLRKIRIAAKQLRLLPTEKKNALLLDIAALLRQRTDGILQANQLDLASVQNEPAAFRDRLKLTSERLEQMAISLEDVARLPDPVGEVIEQNKLKNGLKQIKIRAPLGVIFMIFEARPNVITEAFSLAFKSGNAVLLRGGSESVNTAKLLYSIIENSLSTQGIDPNTLWGITDSSRELSHHLMQQNRWIDILVPRGGDRLIEYVVQNSKIPIIKNDRGLCHVFIDENADLEMATQIVVNAKTQRPGVCNSMETVLVHEKIAARFLPQLYEALAKWNVEWFACAQTLQILENRPGLQLALAKSWDTEYLDLKMNSMVVSSRAKALQHIEEHGSRHSECIVTQDPQAAKEFESEVDAAVVYWNASTRFTDGFEFGLGGELGISTQKLHVRGPVGLRELTSARWIIEGQGQIR
jgi:glutamate-5-semialdehyde dehydrogenase